METKKMMLSPFAHSGDSIRKAMLDVIIALIPAVIASIYFFRLNAVILLVVTTATCVLLEWVCRVIMKRPNTISDLSAIVTGIILTLTLPPTTPIPIAMIGALVAIVLMKQLFGGIGCNIFNPAAAGRGVILIAFSVPLTTWLAPAALGGLDGITTSTPLTVVKSIFQLITTGNGAEAVVKTQEIVKEPSIFINLFVGNTAGSLGETSVLALLIGGIYLIIRKRIHWEIPLIYIGTCFVIASVVGLANGLGFIFPLLHILSGGLFLGAIFMATDWVTKPLTKKGRIVYAIGLGAITMVIRLNGNFPEGVLFSILIMNMLTPFLDRYLKNKVFGAVRKKKEKKGGKANEEVA